MFLLGVKLSNSERMMPGIIMTHHSDNTMGCNFFARSANIQQGKNDAWRNYDKPSF